MSESYCPWCNHSNVTAEGRNRYCNYCGYEWQSKPTVFDRITESPEVLAEKLVYITVTAWGETVFISTIIRNEMFRSREEAIAATVARLKEVAG